MSKAVPGMLAIIVPFPISVLTPIFLVSSCYNWDNDLLPISLVIHTYLISSFLDFKTCFIYHNLFFLYYQSFPWIISINIYIRTDISYKKSWLKPTSSPLAITFLCSSLQPIISKVLSTFAVYLFSPPTNFSFYVNLGLRCYSTKMALMITNHPPYCQIWKTRPFLWSLSSIWQTHHLALFLKTLPQETILQ